MKVIVDNKKQLNYHPLMVYFMLSAIEYREYAKHIERLNDYSTFTHGIFKFRAIAKGKEYSQALTPGLTYALKENNVIVRLVDDIDGNYNYALEYIKFTQNPDQFELSLQHYLWDICKKNLENLESQSQCYTNNSPESVENKSIISELVQGFKKAISAGNPTPGAWNSILNPVVLNYSASFPLKAFTTSFHSQLPPTLAGIKESVYEALPDLKAKEDFTKLMEYFEALMDTPDMKESDSYALGAVNKTKSKALNVDYYSRVKQGEKPDISISITKVPVEGQRHDIKKAWGMEITIDGTTIPVHIGSTAAAMVYICTLLKQKMGTYLYREAFKRPLPSKTFLPRHKDVIWLEQVYHTLFLGADKDFDSWYKDMQKDSCRFINQGKSESIRKIKACLSDFPSAIHYCQVQLNKNEPTFYYIDIPKECINVPQPLECLISTASENE